MRKISDAGLDLIKASEALRLEAYQDGGGVWTIGYGHTKGVKEGDRITEAQAIEFLRADVDGAETCVNLRAPHLTQNRFDACVSLVFNIGCAAFNSSTLLRLIGKGDYNAASGQFMRWCYDNGLFVQGLKNRRERERALFDKPEPHDFSNVTAGVESTAPKA